jgi:hypothetical protein
MSKQLIELVLPRLAQPLYRHLQEFRDGNWDEARFTRCFERLLRRQHAWLTKQGVSDVVAALTIHGAVLVLSRPGLQAEAAEAKLPLEIVEFRAVKEAAEDVVNNYSIGMNEAIRALTSMVAKYGK